MTTKDLASGATIATVVSFFFLGPVGSAVVLGICLLVGVVHAFDSEAKDAREEKRDRLLVERLNKRKR